MKRQKSSIIKFVSVALAAILITSAVAVSAETVKSENAKITAIYNTNDENAYRAYRQKKSNFNNAEEDIIIDGGNAPYTDKSGNKYENTADVKAGTDAVYLFSVPTDAPYNIKLCYLLPEDSGKPDAAENV